MSVVSKDELLASVTFTTKGIILGKIDYRIYDIGKTTQLGTAQSITNTVFCFYQIGEYQFLCPVKIMQFKHLLNTIEVGNMVGFQILYDNI